MTSVTPATYKQTVIKYMKEECFPLIESGKVSQQYQDVLLECMEKHLSYTNQEMEEMINTFTGYSFFGLCPEFDQKWDESSIGIRLEAKLHYIIDNLVPAAMEEKLFNN